MKPQRIEPGPGQESVWDYPRPPRIEPATRRIRVLFNHTVIASSTRTQRVLETSHPPVYYIPPEDTAMEYLEETSRQSSCEWKGRATYFAVQVGNQVAQNAAWTYRDPTPHFASIAHHIAFYPSKMEACFVDDEQARAQGGDFYGGWITREIVGPFKAGGGTGSW
jgi:uncharacterized protein (DUF427 family)